MQRPITRVVTGHRQREGGGFIVRRPLPTYGLDLVDPFLMIDEMGPAVYGPGEAVGAPDHPHRGFETVTYLRDGEFMHEDSSGAVGHLAAGDVQWMTAGAGVVHSEMPSERIRKEGGRVHGFQIWVNLPKARKMIPPRYQDLRDADIPRGRTEDGLVEVKVVAGEALGVQGAAHTHSPIAYHDWTVKPGGRATATVPADWNALVYVFDGALEVQGQPLEDGQLAVLGPGDTIDLSVPEGADKPARALLLAGQPINEPIARYGPFVMNTPGEIRQAMIDYHAGRMGQIAR